MKEDVERGTGGCVRVPAWKKMHQTRAKHVTELRCGVVYQGIITSTES